MEARSNMDAKEQHGGQEATWRPRSNMDAKGQHGGQGAIWRPKNNMDAKEQHGGQEAKQQGSRRIPPHMPWGINALSYDLTLRDSNPEVPVDTTSWDHTGVKDNPMCLGD